MEGILRIGPLPECPGGIIGDDLPLIDDDQTVAGGLGLRSGYAWRE